MDIRSRATRVSQPSGPADLALENPLAQDLVALPLLSAGAWDVVRDFNPTIDAGVSQVATEHGVALRGTTGAAGFSLTTGTGFSSLVPATSRFTVMLLVRVATIGSRRIIFADFSSAGTLESIALEQRTSNDWRFYTVDTGPAAQQSIGGSVTVGWHWVEFGWDGGSLQARVDNSVFGPVGAPNPRRAGTDLRALRGGAVASLGFDGDIAFLAIWKRYLSIEERDRVRDNPWQLHTAVERRISFGLGGGAATHNLSAAGQAQAAATAALTLSKPLDAAGAAQATATAALLKGVSLTAAGLAVASGSASVSHTVPLQASAAAIAVGGAQLALAVSLSAAGLATAAASASLSTSSGAELSADAQAQASGSAVLSLVVSLSAAAVAQALASASLAAGKTLAADAAAQAGGTAALQVGNGADLSAAGTAQASASANLQLMVPISAAALAQAIATGSLLLTVPLTAAAFAQASSSAEFAGSVQMSAQGVSVATATAALLVTAPFARAPAGSRFYQSPPSFRPARTQAGGRPSSSSTSRPPR